MSEWWLQAISTMADSAQIRTEIGLARYLEMLEPIVGHKIEKPRPACPNHRGSPYARQLGNPNTVQRVCCGEVNHAACCVCNTRRAGPGYLRHLNNPAMTLGSPPVRSSGLAHTATEISRALTAASAARDSKATIT